MEWRVGSLDGWDDDGERDAGKDLVNVLRNHELQPGVGVLVVVSQVVNKQQGGAGRFKLIVRVAAQLLQEHGPRLD